MTVWWLANADIHGKAEEEQSTSPASPWRQPAVAGADSRPRLGVRRGARDAVRTALAQSEGRGRASHRGPRLQSRAPPATHWASRISGDGVCWPAWAAPAIAEAQGRGRALLPQGAGGPASPTPLPDPLLASREHLQGVFLQELGPGPGGEGTPTLASAVRTAPPPRAGRTSRRAGRGPRAPTAGSPPQANWRTKQTGRQGEQGQGRVF